VLFLHKPEKGNLFAMSAERYSLERYFFTDADFDVMGWHDNFVHAVAIGSDRRELFFDIDYILKWEQPLPGEQHFRFWISPATLVFENVYRLNVQHQDWIGMCLLGIERSAEKVAIDPSYPTPLWRWDLECVEGGWEILASGYRQFIRRPPMLCHSQLLSLEARGGYAFECPPRPAAAGSAQ